MQNDVCYLISQDSIFNALPGEKSFAHREKPGWTEEQEVIEMGRNSPPGTEMMWGAFKK